MSIVSLGINAIIPVTLLLFAAFLAMVWRRPLVMALPFFVALNGISIPLGQSSLRIDQIVASLLVVPLVAPILTGRRRLRADATTWLIAALVAVNVIASVANSPALSYSLKQCINLASVWVIYPLLINFLDSKAEVDEFFTNVLWAGIAGCGIGIAAFVLAIAGLPIGGAEVSAAAAQTLTKAYGAYGTMLEPNLLGSFAGAQLVLAIGIVVTAARRGEAGTDDRHVRLARWLGPVAATALTLSFTRAAWLGAIAGLLMFLVFGGRILGMRLRASRVLWSVGLVGVIATALLLLPGAAGDLFRFKLLNLVNLQSQTALLRILTYTMAIEQTAQHPLLGWGTFTFAPLVAQGTDFQQFENWRNLWVGNFLLLAVHDTGIIGLGLWTALLTITLRRGVRAARSLSGVDPAAAGRTLALVAAVASLLIPFLATTGFSLGYPWLLIGLLGAQVRLHESSIPATSAAVPPAMNRAQPSLASPPPDVAPS
jgi:O-antigen ligase